MRCSALALLTLTALPSLACTETVDSTDVKTSGVYADMKVQAKGNGKSQVSASLRVGGASSNTYLVMKGGEKLTATAAGATQTLAKSGNAYTGTFPVDAADTEFVIAFVRAADDVSAPNSTATLPAPFTLSSPTAGSSVSRATGLSITWDAATAGDPMQWTLNGDCFFDATKSTTDTGTATASAADYNMHSGQEQTTCPATLCLQRSRKGSIDPNYGEGGVIEATQERCVSFSSTP